jgi:hypothetical protein
MDSRRAFRYCDHFLGLGCSNNPDGYPFRAVHSRSHPGSLGFASSIVTFKWAMRDVLARYPRRRALGDRVRREVEIPLAHGDQTEQSKRLAAPRDADHIQPALDPADVDVRDAPAFLRPSIGPRDQAPSRQSSRLSQVRGFIATQRRRMLAKWRRHVVQDISEKKTERLVGRAGGAAFAILGSVVVVTCVGAAIALGQIKLLKSEVARLQRELLPLSARLATLEQVEKTRRDAGQQKEAPNKSGVENQPNTNQALELSREEIQLIKEYIKPAPYSGPPGPPINVGDTVIGTMIPLPSPLTDKLPKLLGRTFTIRNGTIIIVKKNSHNAQIVLPPN